ncbi:S-layer homology domain-containing protein [Paenibacillus wynnii]|uniref:S-layer homology domain-containing protein n=1 Tax=Paenibacillus wynnii TaxID=268407 RepID=UPI00068D8F87|nr:S-layer homology domain-containing protein [Paenibacillus wynnii]
MGGKKFNIVAVWFMLLSLVLAGTANAATVVKQTTVVFVDVKETYWANEAIESMSSQGIISGNPDGTFKPEAPITREQLAKLITLTFGLDVDSAATQTFSDVNSSSWAYVYVEASKDYLTGYFPIKGKPFFDPQANATREDVAVALVRAMALDTDNVNADSILGNKFYDYDEVSPQLANEVAVAVDNKLIMGFPDGTFKPTSPINRASVATLLYRVLKSSYTSATKDVLLDVQMPEKVSSSTLRISGKATSGAKVYINNKEVENLNGSFAEAYSLSEGERVYEFVFKVVLPNGRSKTVTKNVTYQTTGPKLTVTAPDSASQLNVKISGKVTDDSDTNPSVTINNKEVYISYNGTWSADLTLKEGVNTIVVTAVNKYDKQVVVEKQIIVTLGGPELTLDLVPETSSSSTVTLTGKATDKNDSYPKIYINDQLVGSYGSFSKTVTLNEGENVFRFKATNSLGKSSTVITKTITFTVGGPVITLDMIPETSNSTTITLSGKATDKNDSYPKIYLNDQLVGSYGTFSKTVTLKEGENVFTFKATNNLGKSSSVITKTVTFTVGVPVLTLDNIPETSSSSTITISGQASDTNDSYPKIYMNDQLVGSYGTFSKTVTLKEGENVFTFKATNNLGKSSALITKTVVFTVGGPELTLDSIPETSSSSRITLSGQATDSNDSNPKIYMNDLLVGSYGTFNKEVTLVEGENIFTFKALNRLGKSSEVITKKIVFVIGSPKLDLDYIPETTSSKQLTFTGSASDSNDSNPKIYLNDKLVGSYGSFNQSVTLVEGDNFFVFKVTNKFGKVTTVEKKVVYTP